MRKIRSGRSGRRADQNAAAGGEFDLQRAAEPTDRLRRSRVSTTKILTIGCPCRWIAASRAARSADWLNLPWGHPAEIILPGFHTTAEDSLEAARRKGSIPGNDVFLNVCGLMSTGTRTILLSRWRTGGQSSYDLVREFVQELPHTSPADAWQRAVLLEMDARLNLEAEPRVKKSAGERRAQGRASVLLGRLHAHRRRRPAGQDESSRRESRSSKSSRPPPRPSPTKKSSPRSCPARNRKPERSRRKKQKKSPREKSKRNPKKNREEQPAENAGE